MKTLDAKAINAIMDGDVIITEEEKEAYKVRVAKEKETAQLGKVENSSDTKPDDESSSGMSHYLKEPRR